MRWTTEAPVALDPACPLCAPSVLSVSSVVNERREVCRRLSTEGHREGKEHGSERIVQRWRTLRCRGLCSALGESEQSRLVAFFSIPATCPFMRMTA
jgi:hypothetical protein